MTAASAAARVPANSGTAKPVGRSRHISRSKDVVMQAAHGLWERKTAEHLAEITGVSARTAERWLAGDSGISADALALLIRSEYGLNFLAAVMSDARPQWWRRVRKASRLGEIRRQKETLQEAIHEIEASDAVLAHAETALRIRDADFHGPEIDALGEARRLLRRPVARRA